MAEDGIYTVGTSELGDLSVTNITERTIHTLYGGIPLESKFSAIGVYDIFTKAIRWLYKSSELYTTASRTRELVLDTRLGAFFPSRIANTPRSEIEVIGAFPSSSTIVSGLVENVFVDDEPVYSDDDVVGSLSTVREAGTTTLKYLTLVNFEDQLHLTFSYYKDVLFLDWRTWDGIGTDAKAFLLTGSQTAGDSSVAKQVPYLVMHFRRTEKSSTNFIPDNQSGCFVRSQWDWANSINSHKWSTPFQAYRYRKPLFISVEQGGYDNGFETVITRNKIRGRGRAFAFYMETEPEKDCRILGWSLTVNGNTTA